MSNMTLAKISKVGRKSLVSVGLIVLFTTMLMGYPQLQLKDVPSNLEESIRHRRDLSDNDTLSDINTLSSSPCTHDLVPLNGTIERIVQTINVENDYVSLVDITFENSASQNGSVDDACLSYTLSKFLRQVRLKIENTGVSNDAADDVICKEQYLTLPSFRGTLMPGYSLFDLQTSTYFHCWNILNIKTCDQDNCLEYPPYNIYCTLVNTAFGITYGLLLLVVAYELWHIYKRTFNYQDEDFGEYVNILKIRLMPPILLMLGSNKTRHHKIFHITYWALVYAIPFIIYFVAFLWYVTRVDEYAYRSARRGGMYTRTNVWGLDFGLANILYIIGAVVFVYYIYKYRLEKRGDMVTELRYDLKSKMDRLLWYSAVVVLCFFRFTAAALLVVEILVLSLIGIAINIRFGSPVWINFILSVFVILGNIFEFFDSYQNLFNQVYSVGAKVDRDDYPNKFFEQTEELPQLQFMIKSRLLRDIVRKWLPLHVHLFKTVMYILAALAFLGVISGIVVLIDQTTQVSSFIEYVVIAIPLIFAALAKFGGSSLTAGGRAKNRAQHKLLRLEEDFREYAQTGKFPTPDATCWLSFWSWVDRVLCFTSHPDQQDPIDHDQAESEAAVAGDRSSAAASSLSSPGKPDLDSSPSSPMTESHALLGENDVNKEGGDRNNDVSV